MLDKWALALHDALLADPMLLARLLMGLFVLGGFNFILIFVLAASVTADFKDRLRRTERKLTMPIRKWRGE